MRLVMSGLSCVGGGCRSARRQPGADGAKTIKLAFVTNNSADFWTIARRGVEKADAELADVEAEFRLTSPTAPPPNSSASSTTC